MDCMSASRGPDKDRYFAALICVVVLSLFIGTALLSYRLGKVDGVKAAQEQAEEQANRRAKEAIRIGVDEILRQAWRGYR